MYLLPKALFSPGQVVCVCTFNVAPQDHQVYIYNIQKHTTHKQYPAPTNPLQDLVGPTLARSNIQLKLQLAAHKATPVLKILPAPDPTCVLQV